jgi:phage shock protein PspC (stress-responsive transcriptional regulator)
LVEVIEQIGAFAGLAAFIGLAVLALLSFAHGRDIRRLREWAGSAPERDAERKEATSTVAAQRAEELRALEASRTAEMEAVSKREERRRRREAGLPELTRGERIRGGLSGFGERVGDPRYLVGLFVVVLVLAGGAAYLITSDSSESKGHNGKQAAKVSPGDVDVSVFNGTAVPGLAESYGSKLEAKGFQLLAITNSDSSFADSVVMFEPGHGREAHMVAKRLQFSKVRPMNEEIEAESEGANVAVIVGEDNAATAD